MSAPTSGLPPLHCHRRRGHARLRDRAAAAGRREAGARPRPAAAARDLLRGPHRRHPRPRRGDGRLRRAATWSSRPPPRSGTRRPRARSTRRSTSSGNRLVIDVCRDLGIRAPGLHQHHRRGGRRPQAHRRRRRVAAVPGEAAARRLLPHQDRRRAADARRQRPRPRHLRSAARGMYGPRDRYHLGNIVAMARKGKYMRAGKRQGPLHPRLLRERRPRPPAGRRATLPRLSRRRPGLLRRRPLSGRQLLRLHGALSARRSDCRCPGAASPIRWPTGWPAWPSWWRPARTSPASRWSRPAWTTPTATTRPSGTSATGPSSRARRPSAARWSTGRSTWPSRPTSNAPAAGKRAGRRAVARRRTGLGQRPSPRPQQRPEEPVVQRTARVGRPPAQQFEHGLGHREGERARVEVRPRGLIQGADERLRRLQVVEQRRPVACSPTRTGRSAGVSRPDGCSRWRRR